MLGTVRKLAAEDEAMVFSRIHQIAEKTAKAAVSTASVGLSFSIHYQATFINGDLIITMLTSLQKAAGAENVLLLPAKTGSENSLFFAQKVRGFYFFIDGLPKGKDTKTSAPHHKADFLLMTAHLKQG